MKDKFEWILLVASLGFSIAALSITLLKDCDCEMPKFKAVVETAKINTTEISDNTEKTFIDVDSIPSPWSSNITGEVEVITGVKIIPEK